MADAALTLTSSCFYRVNAAGCTEAYVLRRIAPDWLLAYGETFWRIDPLHPMRVAAQSCRIASLGPERYRCHRGGEHYLDAFLRPQDTVHQVELYFRKAGRIVAGAALMRSASLGAPSDHELTLLERMVGFVEATIDIDSLAMPVSDPMLTPREAEVAAQICRGLPDKEIGTTLGISLPTVKTHVSHILAKTGVASRSAYIASRR